jgi:hypothetical protein
VETGEYKFFQSLKTSASQFNLLLMGKQSTGSLVFPAMEEFLLLIMALLEHTQPI